MDEIVELVKQTVYFVEIVQGTTTGRSNDELLEISEQKEVSMVFTKKSGDYN